jgi:Fe2+ transport system protein FeoA
MTEQRDKISLAELDDGQSGIIDSITGGKNLVKRLADLGITKGAGITVLRRTLFSGPVQVEVCGSRFVLGQGMALKIMVVLNDR